MQAPVKLIDDGDNWPPVEDQILAGVADSWGRLTTHSIVTFCLPSQNRNLLHFHKWIISKSPYFHSQPLTSAVVVYFYFFICFCQLTASNINSKLLNPCTDRILDPYHIPLQMSADSLNAWFNLPDFTSGKNDQLLSLPHPFLPLLFAIWIGSSDTGHWIPPNRCKGSAAHARSDQKAEPLQASLLRQIPIALPPPDTFSLLGCCLFQMVPISMVLDLFYVFFQTRTQ